MALETTSSEPPAPPRLRIRRASTADVARVAEITDRAYAVYVPRIGRRPAPMDADYDERVRSDTVWVAETDAVVGLIVLENRADHLFIENVSVHPDHQRKGVGRALLAYAERYARSAGLPEVRLYTNAAMTENLHLYPQLGYVETERRAEGGFERVFFRKRLTQAPTR